MTQLKQMLAVVGELWEEECVEVFGGARARAADSQYITR